MKLKKFMTGKACILAMIVFFLFSSTACQHGGRVISNPSAELQTEMAAGHEAGNAAVNNAANGQPAAPETDPEQPPAAEALPRAEGPPAGEEGEESGYKGYTGPVQGEIKYKEGTPAGENSQQYKASGDIKSPYHVDLIVTKDFGRTKMFGKTVGLVRDEVGMEVLFRNLDIQTAYGGGFVNAINGLESGFTFFTGKDRKKLDWFYWVNGILAPVGVAEYRPQPGDVVWWDYHDWSMTMFIPAIIGSYPQPFKNGFWGKNPGTVIMYGQGCESEAARLKLSLEKQGVRQVDSAAFDPQAIRSPKKYYILLGPWDEISALSSLITDVNKKNKMVGVYVKFENGEVKGLDFKGNTVSSHREAGAVFAYGSAIGELNPVWMVTGSSTAGVKMAVDVLVNNPSAVSGCFGAVITKDGVINVPYSS